MLRDHFDISDHIYRLLQDEPFFAALSRQIHKRATDKFPTAGIRYNPDTLSFEMMYNREFMKSLDDGGKKFVLMHELYHASFGHCTYRKWPDVDHKTANIGMDLAINSLSHMRPIALKGACLPGVGVFQNICEDEMAAEWYVKQLQKEMNNDPDKFKGCDSFDDHSDFGEGDGEGDGSKESEDGDIGRRIADQKMKEAIAKAVKEAEDVNEQSGRAKGWGSVPCHLRKEIKSFANANFKLDPKKVLASFIKASVNADKKTSVTKRNRRLPGKKFGRKYDRRANIAISIDQSGSVSDELLSKIFEWLNEFAKFAAFTVVPFDAEVFEEKIYVWRKGQKRKRERVLYGGTDFNAPTKWVNKNKFDGHLVITDMMAPKPVRSNCQRMWVTDRYGARSNYFQPTGERVLVLD
tara:strand:+ start:4427 stop:5650 length:1224 start_codon:yes stop_codon:yes gene_type:complete